MRPSSYLRFRVPVRSKFPTPGRNSRSAVVAAVAAGAVGAFVFVPACSTTARAAPVNTAETVVSYDTGANTNETFQNPAAALGELNGDTGFGGLNPFNPPFSGEHIVIVGAGGHLTLKTHVPFSTTGYNLGVFVNNGFVDESADGSGRAGNPLQYFSPTPKAKVSVSYNGLTWEYLNGENVIDFDKPTNVYLDTDISSYFQPLGQQVADMAKPWVGNSSDLAGLGYDDIRGKFDGSAGGNWLNLDSLVLDEAQFVRFEATDARMVVDAIATTEAVPEPAAGLAIVGGLFLLMRRRRA